MTTAVAGSGEMCRLIICGPASRIELAIPAHVPLADLMPTLLGHLDPALATGGLAHGGWVVQRLGEPPLDEDRGAAALGLYDGDLLHLRPRDALLPLVDFDDLVDGVHTGLSRRDDRWRPALTRRVFVVATGVLAATAVPLAALAGAGTMVAVAAGALALALLVAAAAAARAVGDRTAAIVLAAVAVGATVVCGLGVPFGARQPDSLFTAPGVLAAAVAAAVAAVGARVAVGGAHAGFTATALTGVLTAVGAGFATAAGLGGPAAAAVTLVAALSSVKAMPLVAARLARLDVEPVPTSTTEFQEGLDPVPSTQVIAKAALADHYLTALFAALGAVITGALVVLAVTPRWPNAALVAATVLLVLLHARELVAVWHRMCALIPAGAGALVLAFCWLRHAASARHEVALVGVAGLVVAACAALAAAHLLPGRRLVPAWGRAGDVLNWVCALAVLPLALAVADVYRALGEAL